MATIIGLASGRMPKAEVVQSTCVCPSYVLFRIIPWNKQSAIIMMSRSVDPANVNT